MWLPSLTMVPNCPRPGWQYGHHIVTKSFRFSSSISSGLGSAWSESASHARPYLGFSDCTVTCNDWLPAIINWWTFLICAPSVPRLTQTSTSLPSPPYGKWCSVLIDGRLVDVSGAGFRRHKLIKPYGWLRASYTERSLNNLNDEFALLFFYE